MSPATVNPVKQGSAQNSLLRAIGIRDHNGKLEEEVLHKPLQPFFGFVNGVPLQATKAVWSFTPVIQLVGLVNDKASKLAKALYGACWSVVYTAVRPWDYLRKSLPKNNSSIKGVTRNLYNANEHFRLVMGTAVTALYGYGGFKMLWSWLKNDDEQFERAEDIYQTGMFNQNQVFASMNFAEVLRRKHAPETMLDFETKEKSAKSRLEFFDSVLFLPNILTRGLDTFRLFGHEIGETTQKLVNTLGYISYGTWAARFGILKQTETNDERTGPDNGLSKGLLAKPNRLLSGTARKLDKGLRTTQKYGGKVFYSLLPGLSWIAAGAEILGYHDVAKTAFKLEGIAEKLDPAVASWCIRSTWLKMFERDENEQKRTRS